MNSISQVVKNVSFFYCSSKSLIIDSHIGACLPYVMCFHYYSLCIMPTEANIESVQHMKRSYLFSRLVINYDKLRGQGTVTSQVLFQIS